MRAELMCVEEGKGRDSVKVRIGFQEFPCGAACWGSGVVTASTWIQFLALQLLHAPGAAKKKKKNQCPCRAGTCRLLISWFKSRLWRHQAACHPVPSGLSLLPSEHEHSPGICLLARPLCLLCFPGPRTGRQEALGVPPDQHCVAKARGCCIGTGWVGYFQVWNYYFWIKTK